MKEPFYKLMLVTHRNHIPVAEYLKFIHICAAAGITSVQLREKNSSYKFCVALGKKLKKILALYHIPLIVNDNLDLALELEAEGVHLGQTDGDPIKARQLLGNEKIIGVSINSPENLILANDFPIDYVGVGAIFETQNKQNVETIWGVDGLKKLSSLSTHPVVAIGGINTANAANVMSAGADGIAVIGAIHNAKDPESVIKKIKGN